VRRLLVPIALLLCPTALAACGTTASSAGFKGTEHDVAQTVVNLQSDITSGEEKKLCGTDLAASVVSSLGGKSACEATLKNQIAEIDNTELEVESVQVTGSTATAKVKSIYSGKRRNGGIVSLVSEGGKWKIVSVTPPAGAPKSSL
jgi:putative lumazine-binding protein